MARIAGVDIPPQKRAVISLTYIMGIATRPHARSSKPRGSTRRPGSRTSAKRRSPAASDHRPDGHAKELLIEGDLRREVAQNIKRMTEIGSYRALATAAAFRAGQRTRTNARSRRGPKRAVAGKKKVKAGK